MPETAPSQPIAPRHIHRHLKTGFITLIMAAILFGLLGYFWLPGYARSKLETILSEMLHRPVTVQSIDIKPYTLEIAVRGFRIGERKSSTDADKPFFSFDELYADLDLASLIRGAPVISAVSLKAPILHLIREDTHQFNITDLVEEFLKRPDDGSKTLFSVNNITLEKGRIEFTDRVTKSNQEITDIHLGVPFVASFENYHETWVEPYFTAHMNGSPVSLKGKVRPFADKREAVLNIDLKDIDLTRVDQYSPIPVGIKLLTGKLDTDLNLLFVQKKDTPSSIELSGRAMLRKLSVENHSVETPYVVKFDQLDIGLPAIDPTFNKPVQTALTLTGLTLASLDAPTAPVVSLPKLGVEDILVDTARKTASVGLITLEQLKTSIWREADGHINLTRFFTSDGKQKPAASSQPAAPWKTSIKKLKLTAASLHFEDKTLEKSIPMLVSPLDLTVNDVDPSGITPVTLSLQAIINEHGSLATEGTLAWAPLATDLVIHAKDVELVALQGWQGDRLNALLTRGALSFDGKVSARGQPLRVSLNGDARLINFNIFDKTSATDLVHWKSLDITKLDVTTEPLNATIASVTLADFFAKIAILPDGKLNLKGILKQDNTANGGTPAATTLPATPPVSSLDSGLSQTAATTTPAPTTPEQAGKTPLPIHIDRIVMQGGHVDFSDQLIKPHYRLNLTKLAGRIGPLHPGKQGEIDVRGLADSSAPLEIKGKVDPFGKPLFLDLTANAKGIDLPAFSPYSGKYLGYIIDKGKFSLDVHYHIEQGKLTSENAIFLDQLDLGEEVASPDAISAPIKLAIALLKDRHGRIDIRLPVTGSLDDPQFSVGRLLLQVFVNLIAKAATAPFALLGSLFGDAEQMSAIEFLPGETALSAESIKRLEALSAMLADRPALTLEITGRADPAIDVEGLKRTLLDRKIKTEKLSDTVSKGKAGDALENIELTPDEYQHYLELAYKTADFAKPKNAIGLTKSLPATEMEKLMLANINAGDEEMRNLANQRASTTVAWLLEKGGLKDDRIFVLEPRIDSAAKTEGSKDGKQPSGGRVDFSLSR